MSEPVTLSGWYENEDGTISEYVWNDGQLHKLSTVADWEAVGAHKQAERDAVESGEA